MTDNNMPVMLYFTRRAHSSGAETKWMKSLPNLEEARAYLIADFYEYMEDNGYPEAWDAEDMCDVRPYRDRPGTAAAVPSMEMAAELFSVENLRRVLAGDGVLYAPWSEYCALVPYEIRIRGG